MLQAIKNMVFVISWHGDESQEINQVTYSCFGDDGSEQISFKDEWQRLCFGMITIELGEIGSVLLRARKIRLSIEVIKGLTSCLY